jgi:hypothetical protein
VSNTWCFGASELEKDKREHEKDIQKIFHNESLKVEEGGFSLSPIIPDSPFEAG